MNDNALSVLIRQSLLPLLAAQGQSALPVIAAQQPTTQGREALGIYFFQIGDNRYGWQARYDEYDEDSGDQIHTEEQWHETTFQVMGFAPADPTDLSLPTAKDLTDLAAMLITSQAFVQALRAENVGLQRITQVRMPWFKNDQDNFEANPSFDFTVSHKRTIIQTTPSITTTEFLVTRV